MTEKNVSDKVWEQGLLTWSRMVVGEKTDGYPDVTTQQALLVKFHEIWQRVAA